MIEQKRRQRKEDNFLRKQFSWLVADCDKDDNERVLQEQNGEVKYERNNKHNDFYCTNSMSFE